MKRTEIINLFVGRYNYNRYLEIGVRNPKDNFNKINCNYKVGIDPNGKTTFTVTSDEFFQQNEEKFDIIFIDGLHLEHQVDKDIINSLDVLSENGTIVMHDCNPVSEGAQVEEYIDGAKWNGTVWKSFAKLRMSRDDLDMVVVDTDHGCGVIRRGSQSVFSDNIEELNYKFLEKNRKDLLNLISVDEFTGIYL